MKKSKSSLRRFLVVLVALLSMSMTALAQGVTIKGKVVDSRGEGIIGASVVLKSNSSVGVVTDFDGNFQMKVPSENAAIVVSYVGMKTVTVKATSGKAVLVTLEDDQTVIDEVVVVGYGQQKKASLVGAITQAKGEVLERAAGISDIGAALTGNLPGVITTASSGQPGEEEPQITIRGASSWNNSAPLVLVDGIERPMSSVDISSVATISVLKDASATAVYGVKGANGVILVTTKRGAEGKAQINVSANAILKTASRTPSKFDSYDALLARNKAIEHELNISPSSFDKMLPLDFIENYRNQAGRYDEYGTPYAERYPNVDWQKALFKDYTMSYNANLNVSGGTKFVKYFASVDFVNEGDLYRTFANSRSYKSGYGYNRVNVRSNLDFQVTKSTVFKVNIAGSNGKKTSPWERDNDDMWQQAQNWAAVYRLSPDCFLPQYSDGTWGYLPGSTNVTNSAKRLTIGGVQETTTTRITTDFVLEQNLDFVLKGLNARGLISWDNTFRENYRGINDLDTPTQDMWINPETGSYGNPEYKQPYEAYDHFDYAVGNKWHTEGGQVNDWATQRNLNYQVQLNWAGSFKKHNITAMGNFGRQEYATGSVIPSYREDWVFRATYDWNNRYFFEFNGAYNGSEKFSKDNRFAFFSSGALGWMISDEPFMKTLRDKHIIDMLKVRGSYGAIGDDNLPVRFLYLTQWAYGGNSVVDVNHGDYVSPYQWYRESVIGNPDIHWEKVYKTNIGVDYAFLGGLVAGSVEFFHDKRTDIIVLGQNRTTVPSYNGITPAPINKGQVKTKGYELELRLNKTFGDVRLWANMNMTHSENKVDIKDDPELLPNYQRASGYAIGQTLAHIDRGMMQSYDDIYGSPKHDSADGQKLPGDYYIVDFNGDGVVNTNDAAPYGFTGRPENTYNATIGCEYKGFSCFVQFYGVTNVTRDVTMVSLADQMLTTVYDQGTWWSDDHLGADVVTPRFASKPSYYHGTQYLIDGSYIRLKNVEIAYTWNKGWVKKLGLNNLKIFVSGNNLWLWSRMPDDRESNYGFSGGDGAYPTMKRYNLGIKFSL